MKHFYPDGTGLFQDDPAPIHRAEELTECFYEDENYVSPMLWPSHSPNLKLTGTYERFWSVALDSVLPPSSKHQSK